MIPMKTKSTGMTFATGFALMQAALLASAQPADPG